MATSALEGQEHLHSCWRFIAAMRSMCWTHQCVGLTNVLATTLEGKGPNVAGH